MMEYYLNGFTASEEGAHSVNTQNYSPHTPLIDEARHQYSPVSPSGTEAVNERPICGPTQLPAPSTTMPAATTLPSTSTPPGRIYSMCTPPRKRQCPSNALTEPPRRNDDPVIQAIARMEARMQQELKRLRADVEGLHRRLDELTNSTGGPCPQRRAPVGGPTPGAEGWPSHFQQQYANQTPSYKTGQQHFGRTTFRPRRRMLSKILNPSLIKIIYCSAPLNVFNTSMKTNVDIKLLHEL